MSNDFDFGFYKEEIIENKALPYCQLITPADEALPLGLFIPGSEAEKSQFIPDDSAWIPHIQSFKRKNQPKEQSPGYITIKEQEEDGSITTAWITVAVCRRTPILACGPDNFGNIKALDYYYDNQGEITEIGKKASENTDGVYFRATKYVIYFMSGDIRNILNAVPIQFKAKSSFSASFGTELKLLYQEFNESFFKAGQAQGIKGSKLSQRALSCVTMSFRIGLRQTERKDGNSGSLCCYINERESPTADPQKINTSEVVNRRAAGGFNKIKIHYADWRNGLIQKHDPNQKILLETFDKYQDWGIPLLHQKNSSEDSDFEDSSLMPKRRELVNRQSLITNSTDYVNSLGWTEEQAISYLKTRYGKTSRKFLSNEELIDLVGELQILNAQMYGSDPNY